MAFETRRRQMIPEVEALKRQQNTAGDEIARAKRQGKDAAPILAASKQRTAQIKQLGSCSSRSSTSAWWCSGAAQPAARERAGRRERRRQRGGPPPGRAAVVRLRAEGALGPRARRSASSTSSARRRCRARDSRCCSARGRGSSARSSTSCSTAHAEHGYREVAPPVLANAATLTGTGQLPKFEEDLYKAGEGALPRSRPPRCRSRTSTATRCSTAGRCRCATPPTRRASAARPAPRRRHPRHDPRAPVRQGRAGEVRAARADLRRARALTADAEEVLKRLGLPYRTIVLCTGDMGFSAAKTYDIEVWLPSRGRYQEISCCSNTEASRRAERTSSTATRRARAGAEFVHTLNGSGLAVGRTLVAVIENYQRRTARWSIPEVAAPVHGRPRGDRALAVIGPCPSLDSVPPGRDTPS